jgi:predicted metal-dependent peptidase
MLTKEQVEEVKKAVQSAMSSLMLSNPFLGILLRKTWIYVEDCSDTAYTDGLKIVVCYNWFANLGRDVANGPRNQTYVLLHELMHIVLGHSARSKEYIRRYRKVLPPEVINAVADAKVNQYLTEFKTTIPIITPEWLEKTFNVLNVKEKSFDEILEEISRKAKVVKVKVPMFDVFGEGGEEGGDGKEGEGKSESESRDGKEGKEGGKEKRGRVLVNEGDEKDREAEERGEIEGRWREKVAEALVSAKMAGLLPAGWERLINELLRSEVNWRRLLVALLKGGIGSKVKKTWSRPSRKLPFVYPGKETLKMDRVLVLVDTSGSISEQELRRFVSEVYGIVRERADVVVIPWDAQAYDPIVLRSQRDIEKLRVGLKGGGGTCILPALKMVDSKFRDSAMIVIFSDWEIYDIDSSEVQQLLRKYANRILAFTTYAKPPEYLRSFKIRID